MPKTKRQKEEHFRTRDHPYGEFPGHSRAHHPHGESPKSDSKPLLFFFDFETTGFSFYTNHVIEIGAKVLYSGKTSRPKTFSSMVYIPHPIQASMIHGITDDDLNHKESFPKVFSDFFTWMISMTREISQADGRNYRPVLTAHNGFVFDCNFLICEMKRHEMDSSIFEEHGIRFSDTLHHLRKLKSNKDNRLRRISDLRLEKLYTSFFPGDDFSGHRALKDAQNLERIFTETELESSLPEITERSYEELLANWEKNQAKREAKRALAMINQESAITNDQESAMKTQKRQRVREALESKAKRDVDQESVTTKDQVTKNQEPAMTVRQTKKRRREVKREEDQESAMTEDQVTKNQEPAMTVLQERKQRRREVKREEDQESAMTERQERKQIKRKRRRALKAAMRNRSWKNALSSP